MEYKIDQEEFTKDVIAPIMNAPEGTLAHAVRNEWVEVAAAINSNLIYEAPEGDIAEE